MVFPFMVGFRYQRFVVFGLEVGASGGSSGEE
jgi:hypothetical protein